ncbi:hypothetical protein ABZ543_13215 [Streptomyces roseifaciens]
MGQDAHLQRAGQTPLKAGGEVCRHLLFATAPQGAESNKIPGRFYICPAHQQAMISDGYRWRFSDDPTDLYACRDTPEPPTPITVTAPGAEPRSHATMPKG